MVAVLLAGGLGKRMENRFPDLPKPMIPVCGTPILELQIRALQREGIHDFILITGYRADIIESYFEDGKKFGVSIRYYRETEPLGTAGALFRLNLSEDFLLCNGDLLFDFSLPSMIRFHSEHDAWATLFAHPNNHPQDSTRIVCDTDGQILAFEPKDEHRADGQNLSNAGIAILSPRLLDRFPQNGKADLDRDVLRPAVSSGKLFAYKSAEYVHDMGTPERLSKAEQEFSSGLVQRKNRSKMQKAVFLDRDGTLNVNSGYISSPDALKLLPGTAEALRRLSNSGFLCIVVTNQPVVARGECTEQTLHIIHARLETLLGSEGAFLDGLFYCPHHPDKGFPGENAALKIDCECRKPKPALLFKAAEQFHISLADSFMVGDSERDVLAGINAGCTPIFLGESSPVDGVAAYPSLLDFAKSITE